MYHLVRGICIVMVCVDDIMVVFDPRNWACAAKPRIRQQFNMIDFGDATSILDMEITRILILGTVRVSQQQCAKELLEKYGILDNKSFPSPNVTHSLARRRQRFPFDQGTSLASRLRNLPCHPWPRQLPMHVHTSGHRLRN
jgi:hypothetical protein